jgi:hypothetical protein
MIGGEPRDTLATLRYRHREAVELLCTLTRQMAAAARLVEQLDAEIRREQAGQRRAP